MTPERWHQITTIFHDALARQPDVRPAFLDVACAGDPDLRSEVDAMLAGHGDPIDFGQRPLNAPTADSATLVSGAVLASYRIDALLGVGGMGEVYRAHDSRLQRDVAIKVLHKAADDGASARRRLLREARAAAALNHQSICAVYEAGEEGDQAFIAMELVVGRLLTEVINDGIPSAADVVRIGRALADGLGYAHARGVVHGDLKPANVMIEAGSRVKLLDFGLARQTKEGATATHGSMPKAGMIAGTPAYMSPERLRGAPADARSDVWAMGAILLEMTAGLRHVPGRLRSVIARCLEHDPERRYADGAELCAAVAGIDAPARSFRWYVVGVAGTMAVAVSTVLLIRGGVGSSRIESIAVLPFTNTSGDAAYDYVAATVGDQVGVDLGSIAAIRVLAGQATQSYRGSTKPAAEIGRELSTASLLEGSTLVAGDRLRVVVRLIDSGSQRQLWARTYEEDVKDVLAVSRMIARAVVDEVKPALTPNQRQRIERRPRSVDPAVLDLVHAGRPFDSTSIEDFFKRREYIDRAIAIAPDYAPAHATLAQWYNVGLNQNFIGEPLSVYTAAKRAVNTALRLDPEIAEAYAAGAGLAMSADWDWRGAAALLDRGLEANPNAPNIHGRRRHLLAATGRVDEAFVELQRYRSLYPTSPNYWDVAAWTYLVAHRYETVRLELERGHATDASFKPAAFGLRWRAVGDALDARPDDARGTCDALMPKTGNDARTAAICGFVYGHLGDGRRAQQILDNLRQRQSHGTYVDPVLLATVEAGLDRPDELFVSLERAVAGRAPLVVEIDASPWFDAYHDDARYQAIVRRVGFPRYVNR